MIGVQGVSKRFGEHVALDDVSLTFDAAHTTALIGPSGCGKSTLLRVLIGLIAADTGTVEIDGAPIDRSMRRRFGYAIQSGGLFPHLTARRNVELPARHFGMGPEARRARVSELASLMQLEEGTLDRYPVQLSGGQRQRVALMRALVMDPEILLLDEPLGALDPQIRADLQHECRELFARLGKTVVLVTHDLAEAAYLAPDDIVMLRDGRVEQRGAFSSFTSRTASEFVRTFVAAQMERVGALLGASS